MKKWLVAAAVVGGFWWRVRPYCNSNALLAIAHNHQKSYWASPLDYWVALICYQRSNYPGTQKALTQLVTDDPKGPYTARSLLRLSEVDMETHDWPSAREALDRFLQDFPDDPNRSIAEKRRQTAP